MVYRARGRLSVASVAGDCNHLNRFFKSAIDLAIFYGLEGGAPAVARAFRGMDDQRVRPHPYPLYDGHLIQIRF
jgi:hypothetical protein